MAFRQPKETYYFFDNSPDPIPEIQIPIEVRETAKYRYDNQTKLFSGTEEVQPQKWLGCELASHTHKIDVSIWYNSIQFRTRPPTAGHILSLYRIDHNMYVGNYKIQAIDEASLEIVDLSPGDPICQ